MAGTIVDLAYYGLNGTSRHKVGRVFIDCRPESNSLVMHVAVDEGETSMTAADIMSIIESVPTEIVFQKRGANDMH